MRKLLLLPLLLLPCLTLANIKINLKGTVHSGVIHSNASPKGFQKRVITEKDRATFGVQNTALKNTIKRINGKIPDEVYLTCDTPYTDLYKRYGWKQVHVKIQPLTKHYFVDFSSDTVKLSKTKYENTNSRPKDTFINENAFLNNTIHSYWMKAAQVKGVDVIIRFNFNVDANLAIFEKSLPFGMNRRYIEKRYYETNATLRLDSGQKVTAELEALKGTIKVEVPYEISLSGVVVAKYNEMYKDRYFHTFDINEIIRTNNITTPHSLYQTLIYEVCYDTQLHIRDSTDAVLRSFPAKDKVGTKGLKKATHLHDDNIEGVPMTRKTIKFEIPHDLDIEIVHDEHNDEESEDTVEKIEIPAKENKEM